MRARLGARLTTIGVLSIAGVLGTAAVSWACHPEITANTECGGVVHFTTTAWTTSNSAARTNPTIGVSYSTNGGSSFTSLPQQSAYHFGADDNYSFGDTFNLEALNPGAALPSSVIVMATALGNWANGDTSHSSRQTGALPMTPCAAKPGATISEVQCSAEGAVFVRLTNDGDQPAAFTISGPDGTQPVTVAGHGSATRTETPAEDSDATYTVTADGMSAVTNTVHRDCVQPAPVATLTHDCDGIHALFANTAGTQEAVFSVTTSDGTTEQVVVPAGESATRTYPVAEGETRTVSINSPGMGPASDTFTCHCAQDVTPPSTGGNDGGSVQPPAGSGSGGEQGTSTGSTGTTASTGSTGSTGSQHTPSTTGTKSTGSSVLAVTDRKSQSRHSPVAARSASSARQLPFTGTNTVDLLTAGLLIVVLGAAMTSAGRRRGDVD